VINKHFFKVLIIFTAMIIVGLIGVFLASHFDKDSEQSKVSNTALPVAK